MPVRGNSDALAGLLAGDKSRSSDSSKSDFSGIDFGSALANVLGLLDSGSAALAGNSDQVSEGYSGGETSKPSLSPLQPAAARPFAYSMADLTGQSNLPVDTPPQLNSPELGALSSAATSGTGTATYRTISASSIALPLNLRANEPKLNSGQPIAPAHQPSSPLSTTFAAHAPITHATSKTATSTLWPTIRDKADVSERPEAAELSGTTGVVGKIEDSQSHAKTNSSAVRSDNSTATEIPAWISHSRTQTPQHVSDAQRNSPDAAANPNSPKILPDAPSPSQPINYDAAASRAASPLATVGVVESHESTGSTRVDTPAPIVQSHQPVITGASTHTANLKIELDAGDSVRASVRERSGVVDVRVIANDQQTARHLTGEIPELRRTLDASGMKLQTAQVSYRSNDQKQHSDPEPNESPEQPSADDNSRVFTLEETSR